jgi:RHS repeat-associated protein
MERTRRDSVCSTSAHGCESTLTRFVWAGDQLLWELRVPGGDRVTSGPSGLDATSASGAMYGRVSYFHAGGIDKPLLITKEGVESVVPRDTWRGQFHAGTSPTTGVVRDCQQGAQSGCLLIAWPGWKTTASHSWGGEEAPDIDVWYGGLVDGMRDASGQLYMRNRYYDPATGQFTQTDPIGLAGGLNVYGFAAGDPVSYSDPYGLCPWLTLSGWVPCDPQPSKAGRISSGEGRYAVRNPWVAAYSFLHYSRFRDWGEEQGSAQVEANPSRNAGNVANAARHQLWQCELTRKFNAGEAAAAGNAHEEGSTLANDSRADQNNNAIGRSIGRTSWDTGTCEQAVARNMDSGHFYQPTDEGVEYAGPAN